MRRRTIGLPVQSRVPDRHDLQVQAQGHRRRDHARAPTATSAAPLGREPAAKGIIEPAAMPAAIAALEAAVEAEEERRARRGETPKRPARSAMACPAPARVADGRDAQARACRRRAGDLGRLRPRSLRGHDDEALERQLDQRRPHPRALCRRASPTGGGVSFSDNLNPHLAWSDLPAGRSAGPDLPRLRRAQQRRRRQPARPRGAGRPAAGRLLPLGAGRPAAAAGA